MRLAVVVLSLLAVSCVHTDAVDCGDGVVCAGGTICVHATESVTLCLDPSRRALCDGHADGDACDDERGRCYDSTCVPIACGDELVDPGIEPTRAAEACDDGNTIAGDGCAADCRSTEMCGNGIVDPIASEICDDANATSHDGCGTGCRLEAPHWTTQLTGDPQQRMSPGLVYEAARGRTLMFAGADDSDTWGWDGHGWRRYLSQFTPLSRRGMAMAYDDRRARVILYGGGFVEPRFDDLWQWDGTVWSQIGTGPVALGDRAFAAMAYDPVRDRIVLFGGRTTDSIGDALGDTWEYDGAAWARVATTGPSPRQFHAMTYDPTRGKVMLFGGEDGGGEVNDELWSWDGTAWTRVVTPNAPPARSRTGIAAYRGGLLLYGGNGTSPLTDTWFWDGTAWTNPTAPGPTIDVVASLATDVIRDRVVLVGGNTDEVWEWDGTSWTAPELTLDVAGSLPIAAHDSRRDRAIVLGGMRTFELVAGTWREFVETGPPLEQPAITYDVARDEVVIFGGTEGGTPSNATWVRPANGPWVKRTGTTPPPARAATSLAYDAARERVVMFGGLGFSDTWEWNGASWTDRSGTTSTPAPSPRGGAAFAYDPIRKVTVLFGGLNAGARLNDTWEWDGTTWTDRSPLMGALPAGRIFAAMTWNPARRRLTLVGGSGTASLDDTWEWDGTTWSPVPTDVRPPFSTSSSLVPATDGTGVVLLGGTLNTGATYLLSWEGAGPPEQCAARVDRDGDGLASCADPDCWYVCTPLCGPGETCSSSDPACGDGATSGLETCQSCPADVTPCPTCGDFVCDPNESCPGDCGP